MKITRRFLLPVLLMVAGHLSAQQQNPYSEVDSYVESLGTMDTLNTGTISHIVTRKFQLPAEKVRAIYYWITRNISPDLRAHKNNSNEKMTADVVLKNRKGNPNGFAVLFQDMCSVAKIRCLTVDGFMKKNKEHILEMPDEYNHTWAVVQLGQSPDTWYYVDPYSGCGTVDAKGLTFTRAFNANYFFASKPLFNYQHFPDNKAWQLGGTGPSSLNDFFALPVVHDPAYIFGLNSFYPLTGSLKISAKKATAFQFKLLGSQPVELVALQVGPDKKRRNVTVDFTRVDNSISFSHRFAEEDSYPITVLINNQPVLSYFAEITE